MANGILRRFLGSAISNAAGYAMGGAIQPTLEPLTQDLANETWTQHPVKPLPAGLAAQAQARGLLAPADAEAEAARSGFDGDRFDVMRRLAGDVPPSSQILELLNRGAIDAEGADAGLALTGLRPEWRVPFTQLRFVLPSPTDLVLWAVREVFNPEQRAALDLDAEYPEAFTARAAQAGIREADARNHWAAHWQLPALTQGAEMFFRGAISRDRFDGLLKALDYAPTWREPLLTIMRPIPGLSDMVRFAVREAYDDAKARALGLDAEFPQAFADAAALHGLDEADARRYWRAHWRLPSALQGYRMLWRGEIDTAQLDALLKALDYPEQWRDRLRNIAYLVPGRVDLRRLYAAGIIDRAEVLAGYKRLGYHPATAAQLTDLAVELAAEAGDSHVGKARTQLWTTTHRSYVAGESDDDDARAALDKVGVSDAARPQVLALWQAERELVRKQLTAAQVKKAWQKEVQNPATGAAWTRDDALAELVQRGYSMDDASTFLDS